MTKLEWIGADWGTSHLRLWMMGADGQVLAQEASDSGMAGLKAEDFEAAFLALAGPHLAEGRTVPVICCGMAGSRQGWAEAPYAKVPCAPPEISGAARAATLDPRVAVHILPGIKQLQPADVMRGEETQIAGFLAGNENFDGVLCLPGTHTKWVHISAGEIVSFRTFMTGELFSLLGKQSVLRHSAGGDGWDGAAFSEAVADTMSRPAGLAAELFSIRAASLLAGMEPDTARARLSGLLIGAELAAARPYWLGQQVAIIGAPGIAGAYQSALQTQGVPASVAKAEDMTLAGLQAAYGSLSKDSA